MVYLIVFRRMADDKPLGDEDTGEDDGEEFECSQHGTSYDEECDECYPDIDFFGDGDEYGEE